jgi:hypothetical protein
MDWQIYDFTTDTRSVILEASIIFMVDGEKARCIKARASNIPHNQWIPSFMIFDMVCMGNDPLTLYYKQPPDIPPDMVYHVDAAISQLKHVSDHLHKFLHE